MSAVGLLDDLTHWWWVGAKRALEAHCALESAVGADGPLIARDGSLVSLWRLEGSRRLMGDEELDELLASWVEGLNNLFLGPGHALHLVYERDPGDGAAVAAGAVERQRASARRSGLDLEDLFAERVERLGGYLAREWCVVAAWTRPSCLMVEQAKRDRDDAVKRLKRWAARGWAAQCPQGVYRSLPARHAAFDAAIAEAVRVSAVSMRRLDACEALRWVRRAVNGPQVGAHTWRADIPGVERPPPREGKGVEGGLWAPLAEQLITVEPESTAERVALGGRAYAPLDMTLGPRAGRPFRELLARVVEAGAPVRFSVLIEGGGGGAVATWKRAAASVVGWSAHENRLIRDVFEALARREADGEAVVRVRMSWLTWAGLGEDEELERRRWRVMQACESWGELSVSALTGDPLEAFAGTVPGFGCAGTGEAAVAPLVECLRLLPWDRPASVAGSGHAFRSGDGKLLMHGGATTGVGFDVVYGIPGRGKSVLMNALSLAFVLGEGVAGLPYQVTVDIGPSSQGLISLLREALPAHRRHEVGWYRLTLTERDAINPFDTQLGCRYPLPSERAFLMNLLGLVLTRPGEQGLPDGVSEAIGMAIDAAYRLRAGEAAGSEAHEYLRGQVPDVDAAIERASVHLGDRATWWDVVDALFDAGDEQHAMLAQRFAVPVLLDLVTTVREAPIQDLIGEARYGAGGTETVTAATVRILTGTANRWPNLVSRTRFDVGGVRVAAVDLAEVAAQGSAEADRQTAVMYLLARHALIRHWSMSEDMLDHVPARYRAWHAERVRASAETPKRLCYDEFHRAGQAGAVVAQVERDAREARKQRLEIVVASQMLEDFGQRLTALATRFWVLGSGRRESEIEEVGRVFGLGGSVRGVLRHRLTGPREGGAPGLVMLGETDRIEQLVVNTLGPIELWALTTKPVDVALRRRLYESVEPKRARALLARRYPSGSAATDVARRVRLAEERGRNEEAREAVVLDAMVAELVR
ncbi:MAG: type IV secretion protein IcmB [Gammaproteobacteria bacterium]|nr:type IV secretion protein IcmB [Gammaproteobacteria bacterium]